MSGAPGLSHAAGTYELHVERLPVPSSGDGEEFAVAWHSDGEWSTLAPMGFLRGDCNGDGTVDISDPVCALNWLFVGEATPGCIAATNTNGDAEVNIADPVSLLNYLFGAGPAPVEPFPDCGPGALPADDELGCANPPTCQ